MKKFLLAASFALSTCGHPAAAADPIMVLVEAPQPCLPDAEARVKMVEQYAETFRQIVIGTDGVTRELWINSEIGTFSILEPYGDGQLCLMAYGQSDAFISNPA